MSGPEQGVTVRTGGISTLFEVTAATVDGAYGLVRQVVPPGLLMWPHVHTHEDQVAVVLRGRLGVRVGEREWVAGEGEVVIRPRAIPHTVWNATTEDVEILEITSPGVFENYFWALGELTAEGRLAEAPCLAQRHGVAGVEGWTDELCSRYGVRYP